MTESNLRINRRQASLGLLSGFGVLAAPSILRAQTTFPNRTLRVIVPYTAGGATDAVARLVAQAMSEQLGQQIVVENRPGAGGTLGTREGIVATPDGYTIVFGNVSTLVLNGFLFNNLTFNARADLQPIGLIADVPNILVVNPSLPVDSVGELVDLLLKEPGRHSYGTPGLGTIMHLSMVLFQSLTGTKVNHIPYRGSAPALQDVAAGQLSLMFDNFAGPLALIQGGQLKPLAVSTEARVPALPDVPNFADSGLDNFVNQSWFGFATQKDTSEEIRQILETAMLAALDDATVQQRLQELGNVPHRRDGAGFAEFWDQQATYWQPITEMSGIQLE